MFVGVILLAVALYVSLLGTILYFQTKPTERTNAYLRWFRKDREIHRQVNRAWREGNW